MRFLVNMEQKLIKKTIIGLMAIGIVSGGLIIGLQVPEKLSYEEAEMLKKIYNYEIQARGGITLKDVNKNNLIEKLNKEIENKEVLSTSTIDGVEISVDDYKILRSGLFKKAEQKSLIEETLGT